MNHPGINAAPIEDRLGRVLLDISRHQTWATRVLGEEVETWEDRFLTQESARESTTRLDSADLQKDLAVMSTFSTRLLRSVRTLRRRLERGALDLSPDARATLDQEGAGQSSPRRSGP